MISRRNFLKSLGLGIGVAATLPSTAVGSVLKELLTQNKIHNPYPILHGDGVTDDSFAMQALINGNKVLYDGNVIQNELLLFDRKIVCIPPGNYSITAGIVMELK